MAKPRIFVSSTFYDLRYVREHVCKFIENQGYTPILNERGHIPYGNMDALDKYCYEEIEQCDILISIIGGRYGSESSEASASISQRELYHAIRLGKQVYIFVDKNVRAEYDTFLLNKNRKIKFKYVDDPRIYDFIEELHSMGINKPMFPFETSEDIILMLKEQWAGLFQRLLRREERSIEYDMVEGLRDTAGKMRLIIDYFLEREDNREVIIPELVSLNHPLIYRFGHVLGIPYKVVFSNLSQLSTFLMNWNFQFIEYDHDMILELFEDLDEYFIWRTNLEGTDVSLSISRILFGEDGQILPMTFEEWNDDLIRFVYIEPNNQVAATDNE